MIRNRFLALPAIAVLAMISGTASASDSFISRMLTAPHDEGRWLNRRLTIRHHNQDMPWSVSSRHEDNFISRAFTQRDDRGRWVNRRLTLRHPEE